MARHDPAELKRMLLDRVAQSFAAESGDADDVAAQLFGRGAGDSDTVVRRPTIVRLAVRSDAPRCRGFRLPFPVVERVLRTK